MANEIARQQTEYALYIESNPLPQLLSLVSKYKRPRNKPNGSWLWKLAKRNSVRASKQLRFVAITETFNGNQALELL